MEEKEKQTRKKYAKRGTRDQKMMSFRVDGEVARFLERVSNKGRFINDLIRRAMVEPAQWEDPDLDPDENRVEENEP